MGLLGHMVVGSSIFIVWATSILLIKFLQENVGKSLLVMGHGNNFLDMTLKQQQQEATKAKTSKWDYTKVKGLYTSKETIKSEEM